jgi:hypothetical protein
MSEAYNSRGELITFNLRESRSKYIGKTMKNVRGEEFIVIGNLDICLSNKSGYPYFLIEFMDKTNVVVSVAAITTGKLRNPNERRVRAIGFLGQGVHSSSDGKGIMTREYETWSNMIKRCYSEDYHISRPTYIGCLVDERWHNFQNFCDDIVDIEGHSYWKSSLKSREYALDKDIKIDGNKIYSKDTCIFVTTVENTKHSSIKKIEG